jgi:hypothetical protein
VLVRFILGRRALVRFAPMSSTLARSAHWSAGDPVSSSARLSHRVRPGKAAAVPRPPCAGCMWVSPQKCAPVRLASCRSAPLKCEPDTSA